MIVAAALMQVLKYLDHIFIIFRDVLACSDVGRAEKQKSQ